MLVIVFLFPLALLALVMGLSVLEDRMDKVVERGPRRSVRTRPAPAAGTHGAERRRPTVPADA